MAKHHQHDYLHRRQVDWPDWLDPTTDIGYVEQKVHSIQSEIATLVSVIYVTASATFVGPVGGYTTIGPEVNTPTPSPPDVITTAPQSIAPQVSSAPVQTSAAATSVTTDDQPTVSSVVDTALSTSQATSTPVSFHSPSATDSSSASGAAASSTPGSDATPISQTSTGMSTGAKAGIAIAVIFAVVALLVLGAIFFFRRRKQQRSDDAYSLTEDEKNPFGDTAAAAAPPRALTPPSLSLGPTSHFQSEMSGAMSIPPTADLEKAKTPLNHPANPFGQHAELPQPNQEIPAPLRIKTPSDEADALAAGAGVVTGAAAATIAQRHNAPKALEIKRPLSPAAARPFVEGAMPSPAGTEFSMNSATPSIVANGPGPMNVHRVQLDFKPSMDDELELKAGQLVRLLHEYDDGWALCIRLDRSQQGVVPRTCLSARPVKPRSKPPGPPPPGMRIPVQGRPMPPARSHGTMQRSMSPGPYGGGPQSPNGYHPDARMRSNSAGNMRDLRTGPAGPSPMNPGTHIAAQAMLGTPTMPIADNTPPRSPGMQRKPVPGRTM